MINNRLTFIKTNSLRQRRVWLYYLISVLVIYMVGINTKANCQTSQKLSNHKTILVLFPFQADMPYARMLVPTINDEFKKTDIKYDIYYEFMDISRFQDSTYIQQIVNITISKHRNKNIDLIIVTHELMLNFWLKYQSVISPNTPTVFSDIQTDQLGKFELTKNITGVTSYYDYKQTLNWITKIRPKLNEIVIVHGVGKADKEFITSIAEMKANIDSNLKIVNWSNLSLKEIKLRAAKLPSSTVIFYIIMFEDITGERFIPFDVIQELSDVSSVPVLSMIDIFIGSGTIGGSTLGLEQMTRQVVQMGIRILKGESVSTIQIVPSNNQFVFDHLALQRYDIPISVLPSGSIIKNQQYTLWEKYRVQLSAIAIANIVLLLLIAFYINLVIKLKKTRLELRNLNTNLEIQVQDRTEKLHTVNEVLVSTNEQISGLNNHLKQEKEKAQSYLDIAGVMIVAVDLHQNIILANKKARNILGYSKEEIIGKNWFDNFIPKQDGENMKSVFNDLINENIQNVEYFENKVITKQNKERLIGWHNTIIQDETGRNIASLSSGEDITERKKAEFTLKENEASLQKLNMTKDKFFSIIAHDLKNPFNSILGFSNILMEYHKEYDTEKLERMIKMVNDSAKSAFKLLENLLTWSRSQSEGIEYSPEKLNIKILLIETLFDIQAQADKKNIFILDDISKNDIIFADKNMIATVLRNLISNAIKFTNKNGNVVISSGKQSNSNFFEISVKDIGVGIPKNKINNLFRIDKNISTKGTEKETGTGLGLILCKEFVKKHGGEIWVESELGKGSDFKFTIPSSCHA